MRRTAHRPEARARSAARPSRRAAALPGRRSRADAERTRDRVLRHAERLFARKGYRAVTLREIARSCGVHHYTVQHHFGSKLSLYEAALCRWDEDLRARVLAGVAERGPTPEGLGGVIGDIFEFLLEHRDWVALNVRNTLGEGLPARLEQADRSWASFIASTRRRGWWSRSGADGRLLLVTIEGILHNHVLSEKRYRSLFGADLASPALRSRVRRHLQEVVLALLGVATGAGERRGTRPRKGARRCES